jgi:hypothetical protein
LQQLLDVARRRPLLDAMRVRRGKRKGVTAANVKPATVARLELLGRERALIYKTLVLTGLRKKELASLTVASLTVGHLTATCASRALRSATTGAGPSTFTRCTRHSARC